MTGRNRKIMQLWSYEFKDEADPWKLENTAGAEEPLGLEFRTMFSMFLFLCTM